MRFSVLGPLQIHGDGGAIQLRTPMLRRVLAVLLSRASRSATVPELADALWADEPPARAGKTIQIYIHRLRRDLGEPDRIVRGPGGYAIRLDPGELDSQEFTAHVRQGQAAQRAGEPERAAGFYQRALELWRGAPYGDLDDGGFLAAEVENLSELRLQALEGHVAAALDLGRSGDLVPELTALVAEHPYRERLAEQLMLALYHSGRQAEALEAYRRVRTRFDEELGVEPGQQLSRLHEAILRRDPALDRPGGARNRAHPVAAPGPESAAGSRPEPHPAQLPHDVPLLSGRDAELSELLSFVPPDRQKRSGAVVISAIDGMAGVGKTALAVHAAHRLAGSYPDGQLFLDLHGFTQGVEAVQPPLALDRLLRAIGVTGDQIPNDVEERAALWRSRLADKQYLVLLDNAATESQVRSLLPASPGCLVLVTSRRRLTDLDAHPVSLDVLPVDDAVALFRAVAGLDRTARLPTSGAASAGDGSGAGNGDGNDGGDRDDAGEGALVREIVEMCGRLPLAIRLLATRLRSRPGWTVADLVRRLRDTHNRLAELEAGRSVAGAFQLSYDQLDAGQQRLFRLLGLHPGSDFGAHAAAALADAGLRETEHALELLVDSHLLESRTYGRYTFHDLLRAHASGTAEREESEEARRAALHRLLDHYLYTAAQAMDAYAPAESHRRPEVARVKVPCPPIGDYSEAVRWLDTERANLVALAGHAADIGASEHAGALSVGLFRYLDNGLYCSEALALHNHALRATRAGGDRAGEARALGHVGATYQIMGSPTDALNYLHQALDCLSEDDDQISWAVILGVLGNVLYRMGRFSQAQEHSRRAADLYASSGDLPGEARALQTLGYIARELGRLTEAEAHGRRALMLARQSGALSVEGNAHNLLGGISCRMSRFAEALEYCEAGLGQHRETGNRVGEYLALTWGGRALRGLGRYTESLDWCRNALAVAREIGDPNGEFEAHQGLGETLRASGRPDEALVHLREALQLARSLQQAHDEARAHDALGQTYRDLGDVGRTREHWRQARDMYQRSGAPDADAVDARLAALGDG